MPSPSEIDRRILAIAACNHGAVARWQLRAADCDSRGEQRRVARGMLRPALRTSYFVGAGAGTDSPSVHARIAAAVLAGGERARLGGLQLAVLRGCWNRRVARIDVWSPNVHDNDPQPTGVRFHRLRAAGCDPGEDVVDGIAAVDVLTMLTQVGRELDEWQLPYVFNESECAGLFARPDFERTLHAYRGCRGVRALRAGWNNYLAGSTGTHNATEDRLLARLVRIAEPPLVSVRNATGIAGLVPDFVYVDRGKVLEVDGHWVHGRPMAAEADRARDEAHRRAGWEVMRIPARRVWYDLEDLIEDVVAFLGA